MFIKSRSFRTRAWTLTEMLVGAAILTISGMRLSTVYTYSLRSFAALTNYATLDRENRYAMDMLTREIRQAKQVVGYATNGTSTLTIINGDTQTVTYSFSPTTKQMLRQVSGGDTQVLLTNCNT